MPRIVVGVDGSEHSRRALNWALQEARLRGASVEVLHAWHIPYVAMNSGPGIFLVQDDLEEAARTLLHGLVRDADKSGLARPPEEVLVNGSPAQALIEKSEGADMLVVGSRGLGGFVGLVLGSVSHQVAHHARCPVVIIPADG